MINLSPKFGFANLFIAIVLLTASALLNTTVASAQTTEDGFNMDWHTIDCGGGEGFADDWNIQGTIAQLDAGSMSGESVDGLTGEIQVFTLDGGFWPGSNQDRPTCEGDLSVNSIVDIDDLVIVITSWGGCPQPCPPHCAADVNDDCLVNIDDLVAVITNWGACP